MIIVNLDVQLAKKKMKLGELADIIGITNANLSIRFSTLNAICQALDCQPGDILEFTDDEE